MLIGGRGVCNWLRNVSDRGSSSSNTLGLSGLSDLSLNSQSDDKRQEDDGQGNESSVPSRVGSIFVSQNSSDIGGGNVQDDGHASSQESHSTASIRKSSKDDGVKTSSGIVNSVVTESRRSGEVAIVISNLSFADGIVKVVSTGSSESVVVKDVQMSVETSSVVDSVALHHSDGKDDDGSNDQNHSEKSGDDHEESSTFHGSSVSSNARVQKMHKDEPRDPSDNHEDQNCGVNPLECGVVFVDCITSDTRSVNEAVGSIKESHLLIDGRIVVVELILRYVVVCGVVLGIPPRSTHGNNVEKCSQIGQNKW